MAPTQDNSSKRRTIPFQLSRLAVNVAAHCAGILLLGVPILVHAESETLTKARELDWVPIEELTPEQLRNVPAACCGAYIAPPRTDPEADLEPATANLLGTADNSESEKQTRIVLSENVHLTQGRRSIYTDRFTLDKDTSEAELTGNIQVREPGMVMRAEQAYINMETGDARLDNASFALYETRVHGTAKKLSKFGDKVVSLDGGSFTGCEPGDNSWSIEGSNITIHNDKHYGTARHMRLHVKDIPVLYAPYFRFPVGPDRLTGFLFPSLGLDSSDGIGEFSAPFYWNIAPNYDATITPRYLSDHGYLLDLQLRHKSAYFDTEFDGSVLRNDRGGFSERLRDEIEKKTITEEEAYPYRGKDRWQWNLEQTGGRNQLWHTVIDYTDVSDTDYIRDVDRGSIDISRQAYIRQMAAADYNTQNWAMGAKVEEFRVFTGGLLPYRELPRVFADGQYHPGDWRIDLDHEYTHFAMNRYYEGDAKNLVTGERFRTNYGMVWDKDYQAGYFKPGIGIKTLGYELESPNLAPDAEASPRFVAPQASLDTGLYFEREADLLGNNFTQTLEPRAFYLYRDYENQDALFGVLANQPASYVNFDTSDLEFTYDQLFRDSRFSGGDRLDDSNHLAFGVTSRLVESSTGIERLRMALGQITYFEDREISILNNRDAYANKRTSTAIAAQLSGQIGEHLRYSNDLIYDHQQDRINTFSGRLHYMDEQYRILNVGYRYSRDPATLSPLSPAPVISNTLNQVDASVLWPISNQWAVVARSNYDFNYKVELDTFAGFEYTDCCYRVRILAREWVKFDFSPNFLQNLDKDDYDRGVFFEVQLRGFGSLSQRISKLLDKAMLGYREREESLP